VQMDGLVGVQDRRKGRGPADRQGQRECSTDTQRGRGRRGRRGSPEKQGRGPSEVFACGRPLTKKMRSKDPRCETTKNEKRCKTVGFYDTAHESAKDGNS
jgi:hypothetical protein